MQQRSHFFLLTQQLQDGARFRFTNWRREAGYAENRSSEMPTRTNPETRQQRGFSYLQQGHGHGLEALAACFSRSQKPQTALVRVQDHLITLIPRLPSDPAARAGGRQARFQHVTKTAFPARGSPSDAGFSLCLVLPWAWLFHLLPEDF